MHIIWVLPHADIKFESTNHFCKYVRKLGQTLNLPDFRIISAIAKSAKTHPAAKKCCGWEEPAIYNLIYWSRNKASFMKRTPSCSLTGAFDLPPFTPPHR